MRARHLAWGDLEVFLAVARTGSLAAAGATIGVNPSTVQRRIGRLEGLLEVRLFDRSPRGYALTTTGAELLTHAIAMEDAQLAIERRVRGGPEELAGRVRVETVDDLAVYVVAPILAEFRAQHPEVHVDLRVRADFADLGRGEADVAVRLGARPREPHLVPRYGGAVAVALYASARYLARHPRPTSLEDLATHDIVCGDEGMANVPMEQLMATHVDPSRVVFRSRTMLARVVAIREGLGVGFAPCFMGETEAGLVRLEIEPAPPSGDLWIVVHVDTKRVPRIRALVEFLSAGLDARRERMDPSAREPGP